MFSDVGATCFLFFGPAINRQPRRFPVSFLCTSTAVGTVLLCASYYAGDEGVAVGARAAVGSGRPNKAKVRVILWSTRNGISFQEAYTGTPDTRIELTSVNIGSCFCQP